VIVNFKVYFPAVEKVECTNWIAMTFLVYQHVRRCRQLIFENYTSVIIL